MKITAKEISDKKELKECLKIRMEIFVKGQNVSPEEEIDGQDKNAKHYLITVDGLSAGTARARYIDDFAKIERVAILDQYQNKGLGAKMMRYIIDDISHIKKQKIKLSAQVSAIGFYEKLGFKTVGDKYLDTGILHLDMIKD